MLIKIGNKTVGEGKPCYFIAEAGVNHNGSIELAKRLVDVASSARADAVKFQKRSIDDILIGETLHQPYNSPTALGATYGEHRKRLELSEDNYQELVDYCQEKGITFLASAWDIKSADFIDSLGVPAFKVASADLTNLPLLEHIARKGKPMMLSTGMSTLEEVAEALEVVQKHNEQIILLHCVSNYPCESSEVNLRVIETLKQFKVPLGYSGHEKAGWAVTLGAVAMGAVLIERHFTLDRTLPGPDHAASLEPLGLSRLIANIRDLEAAMGSPEKGISAAEMQVRKRLGKSIVTRRGIKKGTTIRPEMLTVKGPGDGLKPKYLPLLYGKVARVTVKADSLVPPEALEW
jgi:N,N'-diacetyllegionaminate synthase